MIISTPVQDSPACRLFIGWQNTVDLVFEAMRADNNSTDSPACKRLTDSKALQATS